MQEYCLKCVCLLLIVFILKGVSVYSQCTGSRCGECIVSGSSCRWCKQNTFNGTRCGEENVLLAYGCPVEFIVQQPNSSTSFHKNEELQDGTLQGTVPVQLRPQEINVKLVPNQAYKLKFEYRVAKNFPVDIYFLVDPSYTMRTLRDKLANLANDIADSIGQLTNDYRFGYGTSMDKVILPYTHTTHLYLENPCSGSSTENCDPPHSFLHRLNLTANVTAFKEAVSLSLTTANRDKTEGMFDGMMQVLLCTDAMGWRSNARRILLYASDSDFHFAGDGKLAGIVKPNDFECHLKPQGSYLKYTHDTLLDYPSVGQIKQALVDKNINAIFVISDVSGAKKYYQTLNLPGSYTEELSDDGGNILNIIRDTYERLRGTVKFENTPLENIDMEFRTTCNGRHASLDPRAMCRNISVGEKIEFEFWMNLKINKCPKDPKDRQVSTVIHPEGLQDQMLINVEYECDCVCQQEGEAVENATQCSTNGRFECGVCHCYDGFVGSTCDCDVSKTVEETCGQMKDGKTIICSNVGQCKCGKCECPRQYSGSYCECDNGACGGYISTGQLCSGNGQCECGMCRCESGYNGTTCDCTTSIDTCTNSKTNTSLCSEHGQCICGKCVCDTNYRGDYCQECPTCKGCEDNNDCVSCVGFEKGPLGSIECSKQCSHVKKVDEIQVNTNVTQCQFKDSDGCTVEFTYVDEGGFKLRVEVKSTRNCPAGEPSASILAAGVSGSIVAVGVVLLIIWKLITTLMDREEYNKFEAEKSRIKFADDNINMVYQSPIQNFSNPAYDKANKPNQYQNTDEISSNLSAKKSEEPALLELSKEPPLLQQSEEITLELS